MARSTIRTTTSAPARAQTEKTAQAGSRPAGGRRTGAQEAIAGFIRTLEKLDAATPGNAAGPARHKAMARAPEGK